MNVQILMSYQMQNVMWKSLMDDAMERKRYESLPEDFSCQRDVYLQQLIEKMILGS